MSNKSTLTPCTMCSNYVWNSAKAYHCSILSASIVCSLANCGKYVGVPISSNGEAEGGHLIFLVVLNYPSFMHLHYFAKRCSGGQFEPRLFANE